MKTFEKLNECFELISSSQGTSDLYSQLSRGSSSSILCIRCIILYILHTYVYIYIFFNPYLDSGDNAIWRHNQCNSAYWAEKELLLPLQRLMEDSKDLILVLYSGKFLCIISVNFQLPNCKIEMILLCIFRALCKILKCYHSKENTLNRFGFLFLTGTVVNQIIWESAYYPAGAKLFFSFHQPSGKGRTFGFHLLYGP